VFFAFELLVAGIILLTAMVAGGISLWFKRRRDKLNQLEEEAKKEEQNL
jgi:outer membrane murein-binding lipoprotein Lpp